MIRKLLLIALMLASPASAAEPPAAALSKAGVAPYTQ